MWKFLRLDTHSRATSHTTSSTTRVHTPPVHPVRRRRGPPAALGTVIRVLKAHQTVNSRHLLTYLLAISLTWHTTIASTLTRKSAPLSRGGARARRAYVGFLGATYLLTLSAAAARYERGCSRRSAAPPIQPYFYVHHHKYDMSEGVSTLSALEP